MRKIIKILLLCLVIGIASFILYLYKLRALAVEGNALFEYRCLHVNPHLIGYKNDFLKYADFLNTYPNTEYTAEDVADFLVGYIEGMRAYVPEETKWLEMQKKFIDRWDYQLVMPWYMKEAGVYQWKMYEGYRDDAASILYLLDNPETIDPNLQPGDTTEARKRRDLYIQNYFDFYEEAYKLSDWRKRFQIVPVPKGCTPENTFIPNTIDAIDWERDFDATPSGVPIDPYSIKA